MDLRPRVATAAAPIVKRLERVVIKTDKPAGLFSLFTEGLGLPVSWALETGPGYASGGFYAGNCTVEVVDFKASLAGPIAVPEGTGIFALVFEPHPLAAVMPEINARMLSPGQPVTHELEAPQGREKLWTNVMLYAPSRESYVVYLREYGPAEAGRIAEKEASFQKPMGPAKLEYISELMAGTQDYDTRQYIWQTLMWPLPPGPDGAWRAAGGGPAVRLLRGGGDILAGFVIKTASLDAAEAYLRPKGLLGKGGKGFLSLEPLKFEGLNIKIV